jgi:hypothetical protein
MVSFGLTSADRNYYSQAQKPDTIANSWLYRYNVFRRLLPVLVDLWLFVELRHWPKCHFDCPFQAFFIISVQMLGVHFMGIAFSNLFCQFDFLLCALLLLFPRRLCNSGGFDNYTTLEIEKKMFLGIPRLRKKIFPITRGLILPLIFAYSKFWVKVKTSHLYPGDTAGWKWKKERQEFSTAP